jgi:hypothetical protein
MHTAVRSHATAGVALVGASVIAVTPVAAPLPEVHIPSLRAPVELSALTDPIAELESVIQTAGANVGGGLGSTLTDLSGLLSGLNLSGGLSGLDSGIQTALINAIMTLETATNNAIAMVTSAISMPFSTVGTALSNLGTTIAALGGAFVPIGAIYGDLGTLATFTGELIGLTGDIAPAFTQPLFDIPVQLVLLASALIPGGDSTSGILSGLGNLSAELTALLGGIGLSALTASPKMSALAVPNATSKTAPKTVTLTTAPANAPAETNSKTTSAPTVSSGPVVKLLTPMSTTAKTTTAPTKAMLDGNKVAPSSSIVSKIPAGLTGGSAKHPK